MNYEKIGNFIKEQRNVKGITQKELAEKIGLTDKAISKWERGQGCPDVSVLELLAKELDCSILEILKGRKITNEVIPITEADDYIKESLEFEKEKGKKNQRKILKRLLEIIIIFISLLLIYLNIVQIIYVDREYGKNYNSYSDYKMISNMLDKIENNLEIINNNQGKYSLEDYIEIKEIINNQLKDIQSTKMYKNIMANKEFTYKINEFAIYNILPDNKLYRVVEILDKYSEINLEESLERMVIYGYKSIDTDYIFSYRYRLTPFEDYGEYLYGNKGDELLDIGIELRHEMATILYLTDVVIEVGEINE